MIKIILVVAAVAIIDSLILVLGPQSDPSEAAPIRADNLTAENLSTREMTVVRATHEQTRRARLSLLAVLVVTSTGAVIVAQQIRRRRIAPTFLASMQQHGPSNHAMQRTPTRRSDHISHD